MAAGVIPPATKRSCRSKSRRGQLGFVRRRPYMRAMTSETTTPPFPSLEDWQHWTWVMGRAQQMQMEAWAEGLDKDRPFPGLQPPNAADPMTWMTAGAEAWSKGLEAWGKMLGATSSAGQRQDRRFASPEWDENPVFQTIKDSYLAISDSLLGSV